MISMIKFIVSHPRPLVKIVPHDKIVIPDTLNFTALMDSLRTFFLVDWQHGCILGGTDAVTCWLTRGFIHFCLFILCVSTISCSYWQSLSW